MREVGLDGKKLVIHDPKPIDLTRQRLNLFPNGRKKKKHGKNLYNRQMSRVRRMLI